MTFGTQGRIGFALAACLTLAACQRFERAEDCRSLATLVNPVLGAIDGDRRAHPEDPAIYRSIGGRYESLAASVARLSFGNPRMHEAAAEYGRLMRDAARDARAFADALASRDPARIATVRNTARAAAKREGGVVVRIDAFCRR